MAKEDTGQGQDPQNTARQGEKGRASRPQPVNLNGELHILLAGHQHAQGDRFRFHSSLPPCKETRFQGLLSEIPAAHHLALANKDEAEKLQRVVLLLSGQAALRKDQQPIPVLKKNQQLRRFHTQGQQSILVR